jgi:predicted metal-dependent hydrolase
MNAMLSLLRLSRSSQKPASTIRQDVADLPWPVMFRKIKQARQLTLRLDHKKRHIALTMPWRASQREAQAFLLSQKEWILAQMERVPEPYQLEIGSVIPVLGVMRTIKHVAGGGRGVQVSMTETELLVTGTESRAPRALYRFLKDLAQRHMTDLAFEKAALIQKPIKSVVFRDTSTRWGSCTHTGDLSFCWRLIMAPTEIVDYVVGHEVAHLVHMHHEASFWALCRQLTPYTTMGKNWLRQHGESLRVALPPVA